VTLSITVLSANCRYAECRVFFIIYAECHYGECRYAVCHGAVLPTEISGYFSVQSSASEQNYK
jgi:hypothetical protein